MRALLALTLLVTFAALSAPAQPGTLAVKNARLVYGMFGQERKEAKVLLGDIFYLAYDIEGLSAKADGEVQYSIGMELTNKAGQSIFKQAPKEQKAVNSLGGNRLPAFAFLEIGTDTPPGDYTVTLSVTDVPTKKTETLKYPFEIQSGKFGFVQVGLTQPGFRPMPPMAVPGQELWVHFAVTGFDLAGEATKKQPNVSIALDVIDQATGKGVLAKSVTGEIKEVEENFKKFIPWSHPIFANRTGKYKVKVAATDNHSKKTANLELDFEVLPAK